MLKWITDKTVSVSTALSLRLSSVYHNNNYHQVSLIEKVVDTCDIVSSAETDKLMRQIKPVTVFIKLCSGVARNFSGGANFRGLGDRSFLVVSRGKAPVASGDDDKALKAGDFIVFCIISEV